MARQMKKGTSVPEIVTNQILDCLEQGTAPWQQGWLTHRNLGTGRVYTGLLNIFILTARARSEGYEHPLWITRNQARKLGGKIRRGERYTTITYWNPVAVGKDKNGDEVIRPVLRFWQAYNADQTEGLDAVIAQHVTPADEADFRVAASIVKGYDGPSVKHSGQRCYYRPSADLVQMATKGSFRDRESYYSTLFHELTHSTGIKDRLDRKSFRKDGLTVYGSADYSQEELVAEMGAAFLCHEAGISPPVLENQAAYIAGWLTALGNDPRLVIRAARDATKAMKFILGEE